MATGMERSRTGPPPRRTPERAPGQGADAKREGRTRRRWLMVGLWFFGLTVNYIDRSNLSVALPKMKTALGLGPGAEGVVLAAFFASYAVFQLPAGRAVDRFGERIVNAISVAWWSLFTALTAATHSLGSLIAVRLGLGAGEAGGYPSSAKAVSVWFPTRERAFATSIYDSGARMGTAVALPIVAALVAWLGWRGSFIVSGALGVVWVLVWLVYYRRPREDPQVSEAELEYIEQGGARTLEKEEREEHRHASAVRYRDLFRYRTVLGMMLGFFCLNYVIYFFITWFPTYLVDARHFDLLKLGVFGVLPALIAMPGGWIGGLVSDRLLRSGKSLTTARKIPLVGGMTFSAVIALAVLVPTAAEALALLCLCYASLTFAAASVWSLPADVAPTPAHVASIGGIQNFASNLAGVLGATTTGALVAIAGGSFVPALVLSGVLGLAGAFSYLVIVGRVEPLPIN
ncbi:MAG: MFS transporter [Solirubrobacterales bacterium]|nr:MFS transporter [Solirubrobacterales bacterium]